MLTLNNKWRFYEKQQPQTTTTTATKSDTNAAAKMMPSKT